MSPKTSSSYYIPRSSSSLKFLEVVDTILAAAAEWWWNTPPPSKTSLIWGWAKKKKKKKTLTNGWYCWRVFFPCAPTWLVLLLLAFFLFFLDVESKVNCAQTHEHTETHKERPEGGRNMVSIRSGVMLLDSCELIRIAPQKNYVF